MHFLYHFPICNLCIFMNLTLMNNKFRARRNSKQSSYKLLQMHLPSFWYKSSQTSSAQWGSILCSSWHTRESLMTRPTRTKFHLSFRKRISNFFSGPHISCWSELPSHGSKLNPVLSQSDSKWPPRTELPYPNGIINMKSQTGWGCTSVTGFTWRMGLLWKGKVQRTFPITITTVS